MVVYAPSSRCFETFSAEFLVAFLACGKSGVEFGSFDSSSVFV